MLCIFINMRLHTLTLVVFYFWHCKGNAISVTSDLDSLSPPHGSSLGEEPHSEAATQQGAGSTSPGRRYPEPGFADFPRFSYPESYRDHVYRDLSKNAKDIFFAITVRKYALINIRSVNFLPLPNKIPKPLDE